MANPGAQPFSCERFEETERQSRANRMAPIEAIKAAIGSMVRTNDVARHMPGALRQMSALVSLYASGERTADRTDALFLTRLAFDLTELDPTNDLAEGLKQLRKILAFQRLVQQECPDEASLNAYPQNGREPVSLARRGRRLRETPQFACMKFEDGVRQLEVCELERRLREAERR